MSWAGWATSGRSRCEFGKASSRMRVSSVKDISRAHTAQTPIANAKLPVQSINSMTVLLIDSIDLALMKGFWHSSSSVEVECLPSPSESCVPDRLTSWPDDGTEASSNPPPAILQAYIRSPCSTEPCTISRSVSWICSGARAMVVYMSYRVRALAIDIYF
jgi:hypothetical protein